MKKKIGIVIIVLLVLAIIGIVGMMIVNSGVRESIIICTPDMLAQEKTIFNSQFSAYEGVQSGANVRTLIQQVIRSNNQYYEISEKTVDLYIEDDNIIEKEIMFGNENTEEAAEKFEKKATYERVRINTTSNYIVSVIPNSKTGLINNIIIVKEGVVDSINNFVEEYYKKYEKRLLEQQKQLEREKFWKENTGYIITLGITIVILVVVIIITLKKRKKKVEEKE